MKEAHMDYNAKRTSKGIASIAARTLQDSNASNIQRQLAGGALSQRSPKKQTGSRLEDTASRVLSSHKYNGLTKTLAGSVLAQSNKKR